MNLKQKISTSFKSQNNWNWDSNLNKLVWVKSYQKSPKKFIKCQINETLDIACFLYLYDSAKYEGRKSWVCTLRIIDASQFWKKTRFEIHQIRKRKFLNTDFNFHAIGWTYSWWSVPRKCPVRKSGSRVVFGRYSCNNISTTLIQISRLLYFGFFSKTTRSIRL